MNSKGSTDRTEDIIGISPKVTREKLTARLDNAFIFLPTIVGLFFSIIVVGLSQVWFLPCLLFLFSGVILPLYIGYFRGALILDTIQERLRGWIYFIYGVLTYPIVIPANLLMVNDWGSYNTAVMNIALVIIFAYALVVLYTAQTRIEKSVVHQIFKIPMKDPGYAHIKKAFDLTRDSAFMASWASAFVAIFATYILSRLDYWRTNESTGILITIAVILGGLGFYRQAYVDERNARRIINQG